MQIELRNPQTQQLLNRVAEDLFSYKERALAEAETGKKFGAIKFNLPEFVLLQQMYPFAETAGWRLHVQFYLFALTVDVVVAKLDALHQIIRKLDDVGSVELYDSLKQQLPHPSYVPWEFVERAEFASKTPQQRRDFDIRVWASATARTMYMFRFPVVRDIISITQGLYITNPGQTPPQWCNAGRAESFLPKPFDAKDTHKAEDFQAALEHNANRAENANGGPVEVADSAYYAKLNTDPDGRDSGKGTFCERIAKALARTGGLSALYATFNDVMRQFDRVLARTFVNMTTKPAEFLQNMTKGPLTGASIQCPDGSVPRFVDYDGNPINYNRAVSNINGQFVVAGNVDLARSGCAPKIQFTYAK